MPEVDRLDLPPHGVHLWIFPLSDAAPLGAILLASTIPLLHRLLCVSVASTDLKSHQGTLPRLAYYNSNPTALIEKTTKLMKRKLGLKLRDQLIWEN